MASSSFHLIEQVTRLLPSFIPLLLFLFFIYKWLSPNSNLGKKLPPSPPKLPIIGNLHQVSKHIHRSLYDLSKTYGGLIFLQLGSRPTVAVCSAKVASMVLKTHDIAFSNRPNYQLAKSIFYEGKDVVFGSYDEHWRHLRSICVLQLLTNKRVRSFRQVREEEVALVVANVKKSAASSSVVNLTDMFMLLTSDVICRVAFGRKYNSTEKGGDNFPKLLIGLAELFGTQNLEEVFPWMAWINSVNGFNAKVKKFHRLFDDFFERIIREHANRVTESETSDTVKDFVDILLQLQREENAKDKLVAIDTVSIKGVLLDMFAAGTHTGQLTMEWGFTELLKHPKVMEKLQQEVRGIAGDKEFVSEDDLENMVYLRAVIKETLRMHPPLPLLLPRECSEDVTIDGYHISAGTQVFINGWAIGRDLACWEDPESFTPERFLNSKVDFKGQDFQFLPFGAGRRGCPGITFGASTIELVLANLVHQFQWAVPVGAETLDMSESPGLSKHKIKPLLVVPTLRIK